jgi:hypothetical protein
VHLDRPRLGQHFFHFDIKFLKEVPSCKALDTQTYRTDGGCKIRYSYWLAELNVMKKIRQSAALPALLNFRRTPLKSE